MTAAAETPKEAVTDAATCAAADAADTAGRTPDERVGHNTGKYSEVRGTQR